MPQIIFSPNALRDLDRLREFLRIKNLDAAKRAAMAITKSIRLLNQYPQAGRPVEDLSEEYRELLIDFGDSGYIAMYHYKDSLVTVLAIKHQKEVGY